MISKKAYELGSKRSTIRELFEYGKKAAEQVGAENVYDFSLGNPSVDTPNELTRTMIDILQNEPPCSVHGYTSAQGAYATRAAISSDLARRFGANIPPELIYMTCGAAASLTVTLHALISSHDEEVIIFAPFFPEYKVFIEAAGAKTVIIPPEKEHFGLDLESLKKKITKNTRAVIINSPNNPSGAIVQREVLEELGEILGKAQDSYGEKIYIISDEPYREITYGKSVSYIPAIYKNTVICYSYSKSLSLPGERIGYIALEGDADDAEKLYAAICGAGRMLGYVCAPSLLQRVIERCPALTCNIEPYRKNRELLYAALTAMGYECVIPDGAFYLFIKAPNGDSVAFSEEAKKKNLLIVPGDDFGCAGYLRISYCVPYETVKNSLGVFGALIG